MKNTHEFYMQLAELSAENSYAKKMKVGAIIVKDDNILAYSYNGTPRGFDNKCEDDNGKTLDSVVHAEINCICKVARSTMSTIKATMYSTHSPCPACARAIIQSGIIMFIYRNLYKEDGLQILKESHLRVYNMDYANKVIFL